MVTHLFACTRRGYVGWRWSVTVTRASRQKAVTVDEVVLIPGDEAIVAPAWVPYRERLQPGDLSPGDLLPVSDEDPRLVPTYSFGDDPLDTDDKAQIREVAQDLGLGRVRTLSVEGRELAAQRWYDGDGGPDSPLAQSAPAPLPQLRLPGPHRRPAQRHLRRLRQRRRQRRRPGRQHRPRLRCPLRGPAGQEARAPAAARPGLRHPQRRRGRVLLAGARGGGRPARSFAPRRARRGRSGAGGSTPARTARARSRPGRSTATRCARRPRAGRRTAAARRSRSARPGCRPRSCGRRPRRGARRPRRCRCGCRSRASSAGRRGGPHQQASHSPSPATRV